MRYWIVLSNVLLLTALTAGGYFSLAAPAKKTSRPQTAVLTESIPLLEVVDGDTIRILWNDDRRLVRMVGIDAPESRQNPRTSRQAVRHETTQAQVLELGARATKQLKTLIGKSPTVQLEFDVETQDRYGRLLAYVYSGKLFLNREMLRTGYAQLYTFPPNTKHTEEFREVFRTARTSKKGLWAFEGFGDPEKDPLEQVSRGRVESERMLGNDRNPTNRK